MARRHIDSSLLLGPLPGHKFSGEHVLHVQGLLGTPGSEDGIGFHHLPHGWSVLFYDGEVTKEVNPPSPILI